MQSVQILAAAGHSGYQWFAEQQDRFASPVYSHHTSCWQKEGIAGGQVNSITIMGVQHYPTSSDAINHPPV